MQSILFTFPFWMTNGSSWSRLIFDSNELVPLKSSVVLPKMLESSVVLPKMSTPPTSELFKLDLRSTIFSKLVCFAVAYFPGSESTNYKLSNSNNILATFTLFLFPLLLLLNPLLLQKVNTNWEIWPPPLKVALGPLLSSSEALTPAPPAGEGGLD